MPWGYGLSLQATIHKLCTGAAALADRAFAAPLPAGIWPELPHNWTHHDDGQPRMRRAEFQQVLGACQPQRFLAYRHLTETTELP